jgi:hypothetical protein
MSLPIMASASSSLFISSKRIRKKSFFVQELFSIKKGMCLLHSTNTDSNFRITQVHPYLDRGLPLKTKFFGDFT